MTSAPLKPLHLFISYSHKDEKFREQLGTHLSGLERQGIISCWSDRKIEAGEEWKTGIDGNLNASAIILLLVSADFVKSDYCYSTEMLAAMKKYEEKSACVIPVILRHADLTGMPFEQLEALPKDAKPVNTWRYRDKAWTDVARGIRRVAEELAKIPEFIAHRPMPGEYTVLAAPWLKGNEALCRIYLWNHSEIGGSVIARVFTLPGVGSAGSTVLGTINLGTLSGRSGMCIRLAEDLLTLLPISLPYTANGGDLMAEFFVAAGNVIGVAHISSGNSSTAYPLTLIPGRHPPL